MDVPTDVIVQVLAKMRPAYESLRTLPASATPDEVSAVVRGVTVPLSGLGGADVEQLRDACNDILGRVAEFRNEHRSSVNEARARVENAEADFDIAADFMKRALSNPEEFDAQLVTDTFDESKRELEAARRALQDRQRPPDQRSVAAFRAEIEPALAEFDRLASRLMWGLDMQLPSERTRKINASIDHAVVGANTLLDRLRRPHD